MISGLVLPEATTVAMNVATTVPLGQLAAIVATTAVLLATNVAMTGAIHLKGVMTEQRILRNMTAMTVGAMAHLQPTGAASPPVLSCT